MVKNAQLRFVEFNNHHNFTIMPEYKRFIAKILPKSVRTADSAHAKNQNTDIFVCF